MSRITEKRDVQDQLINFLTGIGWSFIPRYELPVWRADDETQPFLLEPLRGQLAKPSAEMVGKFLAELDWARHQIVSTTS